MSHRWAKPAIVIAAIATLVSAAAGNSASAASDSAKLSKQDRARLAAAQASGEESVTLLIATKSGATTSVANALGQLGAPVQYRDDALGYLRALVDTGDVEQVRAHSGVEAVEVDSVADVPDPSPDGATVPTPQPAPGAGTPAVNPYMPTGDIGAAQFVAAHPTYDGRGVTIGIVDTGVDLAHPSLQTTSTGERKIVDWVTGTHPVTDNDPTWVNMNTNVTGPTFTAGGRTYTAPAAGTYRFGVFNERDPRLGGELGSDVNRDGNPAGSSGLFAVLWDGAGTVWVDTNQNLSFADQSAMTSYKTGFQVGAFGVDNPATAVVESLPFVVQVDGASKYVNIGIVSGAHGSHVAGIAAGNRLFGGAMNGGAPGAKLVSVRACLFVAGCTSHALLEGMIYAVKQANVDVVNMSIGGLPALNDGNNARAVLYNRLIEQYNVQMYISAGNSGAGMNTIGDPSVADKVVSVGTYISNATWQANYGSTSPFADNQHPFSSRGPREDGGFKPTLIAPGAAISTTPLWQPGGPVPGTYALPPGYSMFNGTSMAAPQATGAGALLVSASKQEGFQRSPAQLRQALSSSTRFIANYQAYEQGSGLLDVGAAYNLLRTNIKTVGITAKVPVNTVLAGFLATPGVGTGIHDREGVRAGVAYTRTYTLTRTTGGSKAVTYNLSWVGNDGTFSTAGSVALPLNRAVALPVSINPAAVGEHSAILRFDDPATTGVDFATLNVVVAAHEFTAAGNYQVSISGTVGRNQAKHYFFRVPAGTPALKVDFTGPDATAGTGQARFLRFNPWGLPVDSNTSTVCYSPPAGGGCPGSPNSRTASQPMAGVWEVVVEARRTSDIEMVPFTLTASILGASVSPNPDVIASAQAGTPVTRSYTLSNLFGAFTGRATGTTLGSARLGPFTIGHLAQQTYDLTVTPGSTQLRATIGGPSDPAADLDLFVYNCTSGTCVLAGQAADGDSEESVTINNPAAGAWRVLIDGFNVPAGSTSYSYVDVFANPAFGSVAVTDADALRDAGATWTVSGTVTANTAPAAGRVLLGNVQVRTDGNVLIGSGDVIVQQVS
ncbi:MAG TPA: S8 family serine peptidase [Micromonosporaceae bacterium]|nr:S8 family serine peptidase [Micromonosporaceae bacterium]